MSLNQILNNTVKSLDVKFNNVDLSTVNGAVYPPVAPQSGGEVYNNLEIADTPYIVVANNVASFSTATEQRLTIGTGTTTVLSNGSAKYAVVSLKGNLSVNTLITPSGNQIAIEINLASSPDLIPDMVLMTMTGLAQSTTANPTAFIQNATNDIIIYYDFPTTVPAGVICMTFDLQFRHLNPIV